MLGVLDGMRNESRVDDDGEMTQSVADLDAVLVRLRAMGSMMADGRRGRVNVPTEKALSRTTTGMAAAAGRPGRSRTRGETTTWSSSMTGSSRDGSSRRSSASVM